MLAPVEARLSVGETIPKAVVLGGADIDALTSPINVSDASRDSYVAHFCGGSAQNWRGVFTPEPNATTTGAKFAGTDWRSLIQNHECEINAFGYTFWGMERICGRSPHNAVNAPLGYAPSLAAHSVVTGAHSVGLRHRGKHVMLLPSSTGSGGGMYFRVLRLVQLFDELGMVLHSLCSDMKCDSPPDYDGIVHTYDGQTREQQLQQLLTAASCLPQKVVAVVDIQTALLMQFKELGRHQHSSEHDGSATGRNKAGPTASAIVMRLRNMKGNPALIVVMDDVLDLMAPTVLGVNRMLLLQRIGVKRMLQSKASRGAAFKGAAYVLQHTASADAAAAVRSRVREICSAADLIIVVSAEDREHFTKLTAGLGTHNHRGGAAVSVLVPYAPVPNSARFDHQHEARPDPGSPPTAFVVGSSHSVALASMVWFLVNVWPTVRARVPALTYVVAGHRWRGNLDLMFADVGEGQFGPGAPCGGVNWESIGIKLVGRLPDSAVEAYYVNATVYVSPHRLPWLGPRAASDATRVSSAARVLSTAPLSVQLQFRVLDKSHRRDGPRDGGGHERSGGERRWWPPQWHCPQLYPLTGRRRRWTTGSLCVVRNR